jgi:hypothetical protein
MADLKKLKATVLADGRVDDDDVQVICRELYAGGTIGKEEVEFFVALRNEARAVCQVFEELFFEALKLHVLADGAIDADEAAWLRQTLLADGQVDEPEKQFLRELRQEARHVSPEFQQLYDQCVTGDPAGSG